MFNISQENEQGGIGEKMKLTKTFWGLSVCLVIVLAFLLPFTLLRNVDAWYGSFLLWGIVGIFTIIANFMITKDWGE